MRKLLNVLYITTPDAYLALEGETVVVRKEEKEALRLPLHNLENIVCFSYTGASPALMFACAERDIGLCFLSPGGRFLGRISGKVRGNVLLRKKQYFVSEDPQESAKIATWFLTGKIANCRKVIDRAVRDHAMLVDAKALGAASASLREIIRALPECVPEKSNPPQARSPGGPGAVVIPSRAIDDLMGWEGQAAKVYFGVFDQLILQQKEDFRFTERSRRPPLDKVNALLSFFYTLLANEVSSALETVGLDPYVGFLHQDRPGRPSLALDLMEELRPVFADRLALSIINRRQVTGKDFTAKESGGILLDDDARKKVLSLWQERKKETLVHPYLQEKIEFGLIPYVQALLLARYLRGDLDAYPPFFWE